MQRSAIVNGLRLAWCEAGPEDADETIVLLHGLLESTETWEHVLPLLAEEHRVIGVDLLGHGLTSKPLQADYSIPALATHVRDVLALLDVEGATVVGHSLGGGVALQMTYLWPELVGRLVLVSSGGLGRSTGPLLKLLAAPLPVGIFLDLTVSPRTMGWVRRGMERFGRRFDDPKITDWLRTAEALADAPSRRAVLRLARGVLGPKGQRVGATDRLHLAGNLPVAIVWGDEDPLLPIGHGRRAHAMIPGSRFEVFEGSGHWPHIDHPQRLADIIRDLVATTEPKVQRVGDVIRDLDIVPTVVRPGWSSVDQAVADQVE
ncbi:MAG: alpha/beta hydrolase [Actinobacteria bacterium]|nr:alpha/beta hydrolase [Actinomycetota bacterium]